MSELKVTRRLTAHKVPGLDNAIEICVLDAPGQGNACHHYRIEPITNEHPEGAINPCEIHFQNGPIRENGINGISNETLLAVVLDRLEGFESGEFACSENAIAKTKIQEALHWLHHRTNERLQRGVEGTNVK